MSHHKRRRQNENDETAQSAEAGIPGTAGIPGKRRFTFSIDYIDPRTNFPTFSKPEIVGAFSLNSDREYVEGLSGLKYLQLPPDLKQVRFDLDELSRKHNLSVKTQEAIAQEESLHQQTNELLHLIEWVNRHKDTFVQRKPHFIFYRGLLTKILGTPYENRERWKLGAILKNGTIYLRNIDTEESIQDRRDQASDPRRCQMTSWGYNFEKFLLSDEPTSKLDPTALRSEECNFVFQSQLGHHNLMYAAEIDGVWLPTGKDTDLKSNFDLLKEQSFVELKTTRAFPPKGMTWSFRRFNLRKWWSQSFTVGISHVIAGLRDDAGVVEELKIFPVKDLSRQANEWTPTVCFNFLIRLLDKIKSIVQNDESCVYTIEFVPQRNMLTFQVEVCKMEDSPYGLKNLL